MRFTQVGVVFVVLSMGCRGLKEPDRSDCVRVIETDENAECTVDTRQTTTFDLQYLRPILDLRPRSFLPRLALFIDVGIVGTGVQRLGIDTLGRPAVAEFARALGA